MINRHISIDTEEKVVKIYGNIKYSEITRLVLDVDEEHADDYWIKPLPTIIRYETTPKTDVT